MIMRKNMSKTEPFSSGLFAIPPESEAVTFEDETLDVNRQE